MKGTRLVKENGIHMKKSCATLSGCATLGASVPTAVVHSRAEAYPLQGWFERRQTTTLQHPALKQGAGSPRPPRCAGGWVPRATAIGGSGQGED